MRKAIYVITNKINGKQYIGQSVHPDKRWLEHCRKAKNNQEKYPIHLAIKKYGEKNFSFEVIEWTTEYDKREAYYINLYNTLSPYGYNVVPGGSSPILKGEQNPRNTVSNIQVQQIIALLKDNKQSDRAIAKIVGTTDKIVADINHGITHKQNGLKYPIRIKKGMQKLTEQQADEIKYLLKYSSLSFTQIAERFHVTKANISQINNGRSFKRDKDSYPIRPFRRNQ